MFEYALGRHLAHNLGQPLLMDFSFFGDHEALGWVTREYALHIFSNIHAREAVPAERHLPGKYLSRKPYKAYNRLRKVLGLTPAFTWVLENDTADTLLRFDPRALQARGELVYVDGFWQNENYFVAISDLIRHEFTFPPIRSAANRRLAEQIAGTTAVSLHLRRGDYVNGALGSTWLNACTVDYYQRAATRIAEQVSNPTLFVFSDEIEWAQQNLHLPFPVVYVNHNKGEEAFEDMRLMSLCQHHIIANSTFSWWGAWLNPRPNKIVIAPQEWIVKGNITADMVVPKEWLQVSILPDA